MLLRTPISKSFYLHHCKPFLVELVSDWYPFPAKKNTYLPEPTQSPYLPVLLTTRTQEQSSCTGFPWHILVPPFRPENHLPTRWLRHSRKRHKLDKAVYILWLAPLSRFFCLVKVMAWEDKVLAWEVKVLAWEVKVLALVVQVLGLVVCHHLRIIRV